VGNGERIDILRDSWIPGFRAGTFTTQQALPVSISKVSYLLDVIAKAWDMDKVQTFFPEPMVHAITQIPISRLGGDDFVSWPHARLGIYTVRSAYNMARSAAFFSKRGASGHGETSDRTSDEKGWKAIWAVNSPNKMKIVMWRMAHDCLPTGAQLQRRRIPAMDQCVFCGRSERVEHIFLFCPFARTIWKAVRDHVQLKLDRKSFSSMK
jgi:hypothetical protein